jgi:hypothetical protein
MLRFEEINFCILADITGVGGLCAAVVSSFFYSDAQDAREIADLSR